MQISLTNLLGAEQLLRSADNRQHPVPTGSDLSNGSEIETYGENRIDGEGHFYWLIMLQWFAKNN